MIVKITRPCNASYTCEDSVRCYRTNFTAITQRNRLNCQFPTTDITVDPTFAFNILNHLPDPLIWVTPVKNAAGTIEDFVVGYCNHQANEIINHPKGNLQNLRILRDGIPSPQSAAANFENFLKVYQTGAVEEHSVFAHYSGREFEVVRRCVDDGVLSVTRDRKAQREAEKKEQEKSALLNGIIDHSPIGIMVYQAQRNGANEITDFQIRLYNQVSHSLTGVPEEQRKTLSFRRLLQILKSDEVFDRYCNLVETGEPFTLTYFSGLSKNWLQLTAVKLDDGFLVSIADVSEANRAAQSLQQQSHYLNAILNASISAVATMEAVRNENNEIIDLRYQRVNNRFLEWLQKSEAEVLSSTMLSLFPNTKSSGIFQLYCTVIEEGSPQKLEVQYLDEQVNVWYDLSIERLDEHTAVGTFYDITLRKKAFEQIQQQKSLLDNILSNSSNGISASEALRNQQGEVIDFRAILVNDAAVRFLGITHEDYMSKTGGEIDPNFPGSPYFHQCVSTLKTGEHFITQYYLEGAKKWLEVSVSRMDDDHLIHIFTDVTSIKEAQFSVQRSAERLSTIINTSHAGFFMGVPERDEKGEIVDFRFTLVNEVLASFVGETRENLVGQLGSHRFVKYKTNGLFDQFRKTYLANTKKQFDFYYKGENVEVWGNLMVTRIEDELLGTFTDFTNVKKLQLQLENMVGELKRSNASLEEFAYAASHDLQEPLRKIYTFSDRLQQELNGQLNSTQKMMFERIGNATMRMRNLIDDLLAYSEVGAQANANSIVNTNAIVDQVLQDLESLIQDTHTKITRSLLPPLRGDERQLRQLFQNLIGNAIKYHSPDREPVVSIVCHEINRHDALLAPHAQLSGKDAYLIEIIDNGIGFEQEQAEKIFQVFQRLHGRSEYQGTGVGLAIVQKVVQNHHGVVVAEGKPGKGATFRVFLPR